MSKTQWIVASSIMVVFILVLSTNWLISNWADRRLDKVLAENDLRLDYHQLKLNLLKRQITILDIAGEVLIESDYKYHLSHNVPSLQIKGINWWSLIFNQNLQVQSIDLEAPSVFLSIDTLQSETKKALASADNKQSSSFLANAAILQIREGVFRMKYLADSTKNISIDTLGVQIYDLSYSPEKSAIWDYLNYFDFDFKCISTLDRQALHRVSIGRMRGNSKDSILEMAELHCTPQYSKKKFSEHIIEKTDRLELFIPYLFGEKLDYKALFADSLNIKRIEIPYFDLRAFIDKNVPHDESQYKRLPQRVLAELKTSINIDTLAVDDGYVQYAELLPESTKAGVIDFREFKTVFTNITNDSTHWGEELKIAVHCKLYGISPIVTNFRIPLRKDNWTYYYQGHLTNFKITKANKILEESAGIRFKAGLIKELSFNAVANPVYAEGDFAFFYKDLDIEFLNKEDPVFKKILEDLVEWLAFPQENLRGEKHRLGQIYFERDASRSIFNHFWKAIFSGMKSTMMPNVLLSKELKHHKEKPSE